MLAPCPLTFLLGHEVCNTVDQMMECGPPPDLLPEVSDWARLSLREKPTLRWDFLRCFPDYRKRGRWVGGSSMIPPEVRQMQGTVYRIEILIPVIRFGCMADAVIFKLRWG